MSEQLTSEPLSLSAVVARHERARQSAKARLAWLHIHSLDDIRDQRARFDRGINIILGKNGVGKTTLLEVLARCLSWDFTPWADRVFDVEYRYELGEWFWNVRVKNERNGTREDGRPKFRSTIEVHARFEEFELRIEAADRKLRRSINGQLSEFDYEMGLLAGFVVSRRVADPWANALGVIMAPCGAGRNLVRFDEGLDVFRSLVFESGDSREVRMQFEAGEASWQADAPSYFGLGSWVSLPRPQEIARAPEDLVRLSSDELKISVAVVESLGVASLDASFGRPEIERKGSITEVRLSSLAFFMKRKNGDILKHTSWSWGQKRLLAFALYLAANPDYVVADELVNGMHHEWIELCLREIADRQCFFTSQNPILVDFIELRSVQQISDAFVLCHAEEASDGGAVRTLRNLTTAEAQRLWDARSVGLQSTSEIMRFNGWW